MKLMLPFQIIVFLLLWSCGTTKENTEQSKVKVSGHIENNSRYLGGARPPQELLDQLAVYHASANQQFYIKNNKNVEIANFTTNTDGNYDIELPIGNYSVFRKEKHDYEKSLAPKTQCDWVKLPDFTISVTKNQTQLNNQYTIDWNSCSEPRP